MLELELKTTLGEGVFLPGPLSKQHFLRKSNIIWTLPSSLNLILNVLFLSLGTSATSVEDPLAYEGLIHKKDFCIPSYFSLQKFSNICQISCGSSILWIFYYIFFQKTVATISNKAEIVVLSFVINFYFVRVVLWWQIC